MRRLRDSRVYGYAACRDPWTALFGRVIRCLLIATLFAVLISSANQSSALIITSGDGSGNTTAPVDDPGFANIGRRVPGEGAGTFIYLGNKKVLTAAHIGIADVVFGGVTYSAVPASDLQLQNADTTPTDLVIFEIASDPGLPSLKIASATPENGADVVMIGAGLRRVASETYWDIDSSDTNNWVWNAATQANHNASGFEISASTGIRWGTNEIASNDFDFNAPAGAVQGLVTTFNEGATSDEAQAATGDSGGAVFYKNTDTNEWELSGLILATASPNAWSNAPANHAIYGQATLLADLSAYEAQIVAVVPEPATIVLLGAAIPALWMFTRRRKSAA